MPIKLSRLDANHRRQYHARSRIRTAQESARFGHAQVERESGPGEAAVWHLRHSGGLPVRVLGKDKAKDYYRALRANEVQLVAGNKQVAEGVASGLFVAGVTDTDDAMEEIKDNKPIAIIFPDRDSPATSRTETCSSMTGRRSSRARRIRPAATSWIDFLLRQTLRLSWRPATATRFRSIPRFTSSCRRRF